MSGHCRKHSRTVCPAPRLCRPEESVGRCSGGTADLVTCNPPYKAYQAGIESQLTAQKIARHEILCNIYDICRSAKRLLKFGGRLCICNRPERLADCIDAMRQNGIEPKRLQFVAKADDAQPWLFLLEGRSGGKPFLNVLPLRIVGDGSGVTTRLEKTMPV